MKEENALSVYLSIIFLLTSIALYKGSKAKKISNYSFLNVVLLSFMLVLFYVVSDYFTDEGVNEAVMYHLRYGLEGAGFLAYKGLIIFSVLAFLSFSAISIWKVLIVQYKQQSIVLPFLTGALSIGINPVLYDIYQLYHPIEVDTDFDAMYVQPSIKKNGKSIKNLVYIYAESLERTYFDQNTFPELTSELQKIQSISTTYTNILNLTGTTWTIGGMVASQCGIPLVAHSSGNSMNGMDTFLSSAVCLGDLLNKQGYFLSYIGGGKLEFAGKGKFYQTHGFDEITGERDLTRLIPAEDYKHRWGVYDDAMLDVAFDRFVDLSENHENFGLFALTLDTHHPNGHPSKSCESIEYKDGNNKILNAVKCSDILLSNFINRILQSNYAKDTVIVLASDHLAMRNSAYDLLKSKKRHNLFMVIDPSNLKHRRISTLGSTLDIAPSILPFLGYKGDIGFGRDLADKDLSILKEKLKIHSNISKLREGCLRFWEYPILRSEIEIKSKEKILTVDGREFNYPLLLTINSNFKTILRFKLENSNRHREDLLKFKDRIPDKRKYLLVDRCDLLGMEDIPLSNNLYCLEYGERKKGVNHKLLDRDVYISKDEVVGW